MLFDVPMEGVLGDDVCFAIEQLLQVHEQTAQIEKAASLLQVHQKVDIAVLVSCARHTGAQLVGQVPAYVWIPALAGMTRHTND